MRTPTLPAPAALQGAHTARTRHSAGPSAPRRTSLYWGGSLKAPARQLYTHWEQDLQLLGRGPLNLGDEEEAELPQARLLELSGAVLGPVVGPQQRLVPVPVQQPAAQQLLRQAWLHCLQLPLHRGEQVHLPQVEHQRLPVPEGRGGAVTWGGAVMWGGAAGRGVPLPPAHLRAPSSANRILSGRRWSGFTASK